MLGSERQIVTATGQPRQLVMSAEAVIPAPQSVRPSRDGSGERPVDILESRLRRGSRRAIRGMAQAVENPARLGFLLCLKAQKCILEGGLIIGGIETHRLAELVARQFAFARFQIRVGEVLAQ